MPADRDRDRLGRVGGAPAQLGYGLAAVDQEMLGDALGRFHVVGHVPLRDRDQLGLMPGRGQDAGRVVADRVADRAADVEPLAGRAGRLFQCRQYGGGYVADVAAGVEAGARADGDAGAAGPHPAQDELFAALPVVFAVDHRQPQRRAAAGEVTGFHVELVVVLTKTGDQAAERVPALADRRLLGDRHGFAAAAGEDQLVGPVDVDAG